MPARSFPRALTATLSAAIAASLAACSFAPPLQLQSVEPPANYREAQTPTRAQLPWKFADSAANGVADGAAAGEALARAPWEVFALPELPGLLARLETANASLAVSRARYRQAAALIDQASAGLFPAVSGSLAATRARSSGQTPPTTTDSLSLSASWEIDLWSRLRGTVDANEASAKASAADLAGVRLALQAQLVQALLSLRVVEVQRQLLDATVADYERYLQLTADRVRFGVASRADLALAETQLRSAQAQAIETGVQRAQLEHAVAVLAGELPATFRLPPRPIATTVLRAPLRGTDNMPDGARSAQPGSGTAHAGIFDLVPALPAVPLDTPSTLLERRPDIAAAERRAAAANAQVGVAHSAFFPILSLSASGGQRSSIWSELLGTPARFWSIGPALVAPLFDGGLRGAQKAQAVAAWEQASATYRQTVLAAFQEVEDQLAALRILAEEADVQQQAVKAARVAAELTQAQYRAGVASSLQAIVSNGALLSAERAALDLHNRRLIAAVVLIRALGGGWQATDPATGSF
ncbi:MAG: TolC family protein [Betaproteobacteria bacterium]|nr:TolC family protein [Betaproteobacteria bacterium]